MDVTDEATGERFGPQDNLDDPLHPENIQADFRRRFQASKHHAQDWRTEARKLYDLHAGHQWSTEDKAKLEEEQRPAVTFNIAGKFLDAVGGLQINNRQDIRYFPREPGDTAVNEMLTGAVTWARDLCDAGDEETDAFGDCILTGMGWMEGYLTEDGDPAGWPACDRRDPLEMYWDPAARKKNLSDGRYVIRVKWMDRLEYEETFGEDDDVAALPELAGLHADDEDEAIHLIQTPQDYQAKNDHGSTARRGRLPVADYQFWRLEDQLHVKAEALGEKTFSKREWPKIEAMLKQQGVQYQANPVRKKVFYRYYVGPGGIKKGGPSPYQKGFTFHAITGKRDRNTNTWFGIGRAIADPQMWTNKFFSSILFTLMTNSKGGLLAESDAFDDQGKAETEWSKPNAITYTAPGALQKGKIQPKEPAKYPEGMDRLLQFSMGALPATSGINLELLGAVDREQSGVLEHQRKESAMSIIAWAFDSMRRYYRSMGRQLACYVYEYVDEGTLVRINGKGGEQYVPLAKDKMTLTFDVIVDEAPTSTNMKERVWAILEKLVPQLLQVGIPIPEEILDYAPLPTDLAVAWKEKLKGDPQAQEEQKQKQEAEFKATIEKIVAETLDKNASAEQRQADAEKKRAETANIQAGLPGTEAASLAATAQAGGAIANGGMNGSRAN